MNRDIKKLSAIEFEILCQELLQNSGFEVEMTKTSGDGGIDLIATNNQIFLSGKYIVQCKRYSNSVGEPVIRDLYGVVMAERANKGILITTGYFTQSAIKFAQGKNIELIDGIKLNKALNQYEKNNTKVIMNDFCDYDCFDKNQYLFYKDIVEKSECSEELASEYLDFLFSYMVSKDEPAIINSIKLDYEVSKKGKANHSNCNLDNADVPSMDLIYNGLSKEFEHYFKWYVDKYYKKGKKQLLKKPYLLYKYAGITSLYTFDLFDYVKQRYDLIKGSIGLRIVYDNTPYYIGDYIEYSIIKKDIDEMLNNLDKVSFVKDFYYYELMNLYNLFNYFNIEIGKKKILEIAMKSPINEESHIEGNKLLNLYSKEPTFSLVLKGNIFYIWYPEICESYGYNKKNERIFKEYVARYKCAVDYKSYYEKYYSDNKKKIEKDILKIETLLETL